MNIDKGLIMGAGHSGIDAGSIEYFMAAGHESHVYNHGTGSRLETYGA